MLRAVLLDFNRVLVDDGALQRELARRVLREEGVELGSGLDLLDRPGLDDRGRFEAALRAARRPADPGALARLSARKAAYLQQELRRGGYPFHPGAVELVRGLGACGVLLGLVSGALRDEVDDALRQAGVVGSFKAIVCAEDVTVGSPDPEGYRTALALLNAEPPAPARLIHPHEAIAVEDSPEGLQAASAAGIGTVAVVGRYGPEALVAADRIVRSLGELSPERLVDWFRA